MPEFRLLTVSSSKTECPLDVFIYSIPQQTPTAVSLNTHILAANGDISLAYHTTVK